ncbi:hypothetical protein [Krasilnikovia sp. MM14-A1259]|uniref:hypothetical protein n=1 Tax=Krasilnikovia sp. MM14-A1259 TaxID=3373539 RepID=UPI0037FDE76B
MMIAVSATIAVLAVTVLLSFVVVSWAKRRNARSRQDSGNLTLALTVVGLVIASVGLPASVFLGIRQIQQGGSPSKPGAVVSGPDVSRSQVPPASRSARGTGGEGPGDGGGQTDGSPAPDGGEVVRIVNVANQDGCANVTVRVTKASPQGRRLILVSNYNQRTLWQLKAELRPGTGDQTFCVDLRLSGRGTWRDFLVASVNDVTEQAWEASRTQSLGDPPAGTGWVTQPWTHEWPGTA